MNHDILGILKFLFPFLAGALMVALLRRGNVTRVDSKHARHGVLPNSELTLPYHYDSRSSGRSAAVLIFICYGLGLLIALWANPAVSATRILFATMVILCFSSLRSYLYIRAAKGGSGVIAEHEITSVPDEFFGIRSLAPEGAIVIDSSGAVAVCCNYPGLLGSKNAYFVVLFPNNSDLYVTISPYKNNIKSQENLARSLAKALQLPYLDKSDIRSTLVPFPPKRHN